MIVCGNYDLTVHNGNYVLRKAYTRRGGRIGYDHYTYYASLQSALTMAMQYAVRDGVEKKKLTDVSQVIAEIQRAEAEVKCSVDMLELKAALEKASRIQATPQRKKCA